MSAHIDSTAQHEFDVYMSLVKEFPLRPIRDEEHLESAMEMLDRLLDLDHISEGQQDYLDVLGGLIKAFEDSHMPMPSATGVEVLRFLMEEHELRQSDLAPIFGGKSVVSEVLRGKRQLNLRHIRKLSRHFHVPADVFLNSEPDADQDSP